MPSLLHESLLLLVRDRPDLVATLLTDLLGVPVPPFTEARLAEAALHELVPVEYHADAVVLFVEGKPVFGAIVEAQLQPDDRKLFTWPLYAVAARARHECPFVVVVVTPDPATARWAARPIDLGDGLLYRVRVIGPDGVPVITDVERAVREPYLAMLSLMAHGQGNRDTAVAIATATAQAILQLPKHDQRLLYWTIVESSLSEAARKAFEMLPQTQPFLSESQLRSFAKGVAESILKLLTKRGIPMTDGQRQRILDTGDLSTLDSWIDRVLTVTTADELFT
ncbi:MAG TPA: hypothetical protein VNO30_26255 [Kofleriaceae bacterium]|nr:hypothetical protein [Kofleriaceae bacterium]